MIFFFISAILIQSKMCSHLQPCLFLQKVHFPFQGRFEREGLPDSASKSCYSTVLNQLAIPNHVLNQLAIPNYFQINDTKQLSTCVQFNCNHKDIVQSNQLTITFHQKAPSQENLRSWDEVGWSDLLSPVTDRFLDQRRLVGVPPRW